MGLRRDGIRAGPKDRVHRGQQHNMCRQVTPSFEVHEVYHGDSSPRIGSWMRETCSRYRVLEGNVPRKHADDPSGRSLLLLVLPRAGPVALPLQQGRHLPYPWSLRKTRGLRNRPSNQHWVHSETWRNSFSCVPPDREHLFGSRSAWHPMPIPNCTSNSVTPAHSHRGGSSTRDRRILNRGWQFGVTPSARKLTS